MEQYSINCLDCGEVRTGPARGKIPVRCISCTKKHSDRKRHERRRAAGEFDPKEETLTCVECGRNFTRVAIPGRKPTRCPECFEKDGKAVYSRKLRERIGDGRKRSSRSCSHDGCDRPVQARGFCTTHYSQWQRAHAPKKTFVCQNLHCGKKFKKYPHYGANRNRFCSTACSAEYAAISFSRDTHFRKYGEKGADIVKWIRPAPAIVWERGTNTWTAGRCQLCGKCFVSRRTRVTCSPDCSSEWRKWRAYDREAARRAGLRGKGGEVISSLEVFERDDFICYLCGYEVDISPGGYRPRAATIDHVIPLAHDGEHVEDNIKTAHSICNSYKRDLLDYTTHPPEVMAKLPWVK